MGISTKILLKSFVLQLILIIMTVRAKPDLDDYFKKRDSNWPWGSSSSSEEFKNNKNPFEDDYESSENIIKIVSGIIIAIVVLAFISFFFCLCCPLCLLYKMRSRRGIVYQQAQNRSNILTNSAPATNPQVIAINNAVGAAQRPYPVQESVTVVPLINPTQPPYPFKYDQPPLPPYSYGPPQLPQELPPPYPGLPRETSNFQTSPINPPVPGSQPAYNPYFSEGNNSSAPPPS